LPGILLLLRAPFLFGYAKPMPVNFQKLRSPRPDIVLVAAAGPVMNIILAVLAALAFHLLFPLPPLDGGRILVGVLPKAIAARVARLEPYGLAILIGLLIILPMLGAQLGSTSASYLT
jgi:Zn-dependent protease